MKYAGLLGSISEAVDIQRELGVDQAEAFAVQIGRALQRHCEETEGIFLENPFEIAQRVAIQMGCSVEEAIDQLEFYDRVAVRDFCIGNTMDRKGLH